MTYKLGQGETVNVKAFPYDARGDGVAHSPDESIAFQNAINDVAAAGGGIVFVPKGTYLFQTPSNNNNTFVLLHSNVKIVGEGDASIIKIANGLAAGGFNLFSGDIATPPTLDNLQFSDFCIDGNSAFNPNTGNKNNFLIYAQHGTQIVIQNLFIKNANSLNPILLGDPTTATISMTDVNISNNRFYNIANDINLLDHATVWVSTDGAIIHGNIFESPPSNITAQSVGTAVELHGANLICSSNKIEVYANCFNVGSGALTRNVQIVDNVADYVHQFIILFEQPAGSPVGFPQQFMRDVHIANNIVGFQDHINAGMVGIGNVGFVGDHTMSFDRVEIVNNIFRVDSSPTTAQTYIIGQSGNITEWKIEGNTIIGAGDGYTTYGILLSPVNYTSGQNFSSDIVIRNNRIINCGDATHSAIHIVTLGTETTHVRYTITDNMIIDNQISPTMVHGIELSQTIQGLQLKNNIIIGATGQQILLTPSGTGFTSVDPVITFGSGVPGLTASSGIFEGSLYQRNDASNGSLYIFRNGAWVQSGYGYANITPTTTSYLALSTDTIITVGVISAPINITLSASPTAGQILTIKDANGSASTYNITVLNNGHNIDGSSGPIIINRNYGAYNLIYSGTQWNII